MICTLPLQMCFHVRALQAVWIGDGGRTLYAVELRGQTLWVDVLDPGTGAVRNLSTEGAVVDFAVR